MRCYSQTLNEQRENSEAAGEGLQLGHQYSTEAVNTAATDKTFNMPFAEYRKLKKTLKMRTRIAGIPMAFAGIGISSAVSIQLNPRMFEMTPEEIQPIL